MKGRANERESASAAYQTDHARSRARLWRPSFIHSILSAAKLGRLMFHVGHELKAPRSSSGIS